jgi:hypothetical protein
MSVTCLISPAPCMDCHFRLWVIRLSLSFSVRLIGLNALSETILVISPMSPNT